MLGVKPHKLADGRYECQNCLKRFTPGERVTIEPKFCSDNCRKEFHTTGGVSLRKLKTLVIGWVRAEWERLSAGVDLRP